MSNKKEMRGNIGNPGNLNIGIPSSISPKNQKEGNSFRTESDAEDMNSNGAVIIDD
jgi:hypothetical protein